MKIINCSDMKQARRRSVEYIKGMMTMGRCVKTYVHSDFISVTTFFECEDLKHSEIHRHEYRWKKP